MELCLTQEVVVSRAGDWVYSLSSGGVSEAVLSVDWGSRVGYLSTRLIPRVTSIMVSVSSSNIHVIGTTYVRKLVDKMKQTAFFSRFISVCMKREVTVRLK